MPIGEVDKLYRLNAERFVAMADARRNEDFPGLESTRKNCVDGGKGWGLAAKIIEKYLHHAGDWRQRSVCSA